MVEATIAHLSEALILLASAAKWADRDRGFSPLAILGGPMKYWKWHRAQRSVQAAAREIDRLRTQTSDANLLPDVDVSIPALDAINDLFDVLPFSVQRVGSQGGPSSLKQQLSPETNVFNQIETTKLGVEHLLSEVGLLHARLRRSPA